MKKIVWMLSLCLSSLISTEQAFATPATDGLYFGHAIGGYQIGDRTTITDSTDSITIKTSGTYMNVIGQLFAGYSFTIQEHFSAAIQFDGSLQAGSFNPIYISSNSTSIKLDQKIPYLYTISVLPTWEITKVSRILLKVGYTRGYFELSSSNPVTSRDVNAWKGALNLGIGTEMAVTDTIDFRLMGSTNLYEKKTMTGLAYNTLKTTVTNSQVMIGLVYHTDLMG
jgi:opacity protein-like surface antigen